MEGRIGCCRGVFVGVARRELPPKCQDRGTLTFAAAVPQMFRWGLWWRTSSRLGISVLGTLFAAVRPSPQIAWALSAAILLATSAQPAKAQQDNFAVSESGLPTYAQPIVVPPGIAGMEPKLSLVYTGSAHQGPVGTGWSIQGISQILRCPSGGPDDGLRRGVELNKDDFLCLDGKRLIRTDDKGMPLETQSASAEGTSSGFREFRTEIDGFSRIRAYGILGGSANNGPAYFRVWTKAGVINEYGTTTDSRIFGVGSAVASGWLLKRSIDTRGNYVEYVYRHATSGRGHIPFGQTVATEGLEWFLDRVLYTGTASHAPANEIVFDYKKAISNGTVPTQTAYHQARKTVSGYVLSDVLVNGAGALTRRYSLIYRNSDISGRPLLERIQECASPIGASAKCLPPVRFEYSGGAHDYVKVPGFNLATHVLHSSNGNNRRILADFNGDGRTDILRFNKSNLSDIKLYLADGTSPGRFADSMEFSTWRTNSGFSVDDYCRAVILIDANGDGLMDMLQLRLSYPPSGGSPMTYCNAPANHQIHLNRGDGTFNTVAASGLGAFVWNGHRNYIAYNGPQHSRAWTLVMDVDGDGFPDVVSMWTVPGSATIQQIEVYRGLGNGSFSQATTTLTPSTLGGLPVEWGIDVDQDGLPDLLTSTPNGASAAVVAFKGFSPSNTLQHRITPINWAYPASANVSSNVEVRFGLHRTDFNNDGLIDFVNYKVGGSASERAFYLATGAGLQRVTDGAILQGWQSSLNFGANNSRVAFIDLNGDGLDDLLQVTASGSIASLTKPTESGIPVWMRVETTGLESPLVFKTDNTFDWEVGDFLGTGSAQILMMRHNASSSLGNELWARRTVAPPDMLAKVTTPNGLETYISYGSLSAGVITDFSPTGAVMVRPASVGSNFGSSLNSLSSVPLYSVERPPPGTSTYPVVHLQPASWVVAETLQGSGRNAQEMVTTTFAYGGLKGAHGGRGSLGFAWTLKRQPYANGEVLATITRFHQNPEQFQYIGLTKSEVTEYWRGEGGANPEGRIQLRMWRAGPDGTLLNIPHNGIPMQPRAVREVLFVHCDANANSTHQGYAASHLGDHNNGYTGWEYFTNHPCHVDDAPHNRVRRPYQAQSRERTLDLNTDNLELSRVVTVNRALARDGSGHFYGDFAEVDVITSGTVAGVSQTQTKRSVHTYDYSATNLANWWLGRLRTSQVTSIVSPGGTEPSRAVGTGSTASVGTEPANSQPQPIPPHVLVQIINSVLLDE